MSLSLGIVGLPNVGKSTLFNALTRLKADASNYPFCTIDPNVGVVEVPDERLAQLAKIVHPEKIVPTTIEFVDIAGLVKNAHEGQGLGNQFLSHIRNVDAICQVVRQFQNTDVVHVEGAVDPRRDIEIIRLELALADVANVSKRLENARKDAKGGDKLRVQQVGWLEQYQDVLNRGQWIAEWMEQEHQTIEEEEDRLLREVQLLTSKQMLYVVNVAEDEVARFDPAKYRMDMGLKSDAVVLPISAKLEAELNELGAEEARDYLQTLELEESGLNRLIKAGYTVLQLLTFLTAGEKEVKAWTVKKGAKAPQAAGVIHTDFEKHFIRAEVIAWDKLVEAGSYAAARERGWIRIEGKEYLVQDGDTVHFLHSAKK